MPIVQQVADPLPPDPRNADREMAQNEPDPKAIYERNKAYAKPGPYETALNPIEEQRFRDWVAKNDIRFNPDTKQQDYDMRGYYKALQDGKVKRRESNEEHFPDTFKTPYHESFSSESRYATPDAPRWIEGKLTDKNGKVLFVDTSARENP
jgi:hypothetical protein